MLRATTLLIVTVLAGAPAVSLACELRCDGTAEHHGTAGGIGHGGSIAGPTSPQVASAIGCPEASAVSPYLISHRHREAGTSDTTTLIPHDSSAHENILCPLAARLIHLPSPPHEAARLAVLRL